MDIHLTFENVTWCLEPLLFINDHHNVVILRNGHVR